MVPADAMPMTNSFGFQVDSGTFPETLDHALARADLDGFAARRQQSEARGRLRGLGFAYHIKGTGGSPEENVDIRFEPDGTVSLITGTQHIGQGHETTFPQILAHRLGVAERAHPPAPGRHRPDRAGGGHGSSRATYMGGTAIWRAVGRDHRQGHRASPPMRWRRPRPTSASRTAASSCRAPTAPSACSRSRRSAARRQAARHLSRLDARAR